MRIVGNYPLVLISAGILLLFTSVAWPADDDAAHPSDILQMGGGTLAIELDSDGMQVTHDEILQWIKTAGRAVSHYYGRYPVKEVLIRVQATPQ